MAKPVYRQLRGYSLDPGFSTRLDTMYINEITYKVRWETVATGPCGEYFEIIDWDPASNCFYDPVNLNEEEILAENGLTPSEGNPKFHQQFVYTIAMQTLQHFEFSLGRKIIWSPRKVETSKKSKNTKLVDDYVDKLRIYPHGIRDANAFYDPQKKAILFGYFESAANVNESNMPGGAVFTCLSPDIVAHEVTHAILDSIHPRFIENTNPDVPAFHEAFSDLVALLQRFTIPQLVEHQIAQTKGNLGEFSFLGELATQLGNALENNRGALRGAIGEFDPETNKWKKHRSDPQKYKREFEPHSRGAILVATVFDAFLRLYNIMTEDLIRIATNGTGVLQPGAIHPDLVKRLAGTACEIAERLLHICIRALDYCPPLDITFGDYLRALITADIACSPTDVKGYRIALIEAFRSWGIFPDRVNTLSEESLVWSTREDFTEKEKDVLKFISKEFLKPRLTRLKEISMMSGNHRKEIHKYSHQIQGELRQLLERDKYKVLGTKNFSKFLIKIGLTNEQVKFKVDDETIQSRGIPMIEVHKVRPITRIGRDGTHIEQAMITLTQSFSVLKGKYEGAVFRGGCTILVDMTNDYNIEYIIYKKIQSENRFKYQMNYQAGNLDEYMSINDSMYEDGVGFQPINFSNLHFH